MSYQANICCDKCGKTERLKLSEDHYIIWDIDFIPPDDWRKFDEKDLCNDCCEKIQDLLEDK